jgi:hypothetical protein
MHNTQDCHRYEKNENKKFDFQATKKGARNPIPQSSLSCNYARKWTSLRKQSRKKMQKGRHVAIAIQILTQNRELGWVTLGK